MIENHFEIRMPLGDLAKFRQEQAVIIATTGTPSCAAAGHSPFERAVVQPLWCVSSADRHAWHDRQYAISQEVAAIV
jgi:hypothetical protein